MVDLMKVIKTQHEELTRYKEALEKIFKTADKNVLYDMDLSDMARIKTIAQEALKGESDESIS